MKSVKNGRRNSVFRTLSNKQVGIEQCQGQIHLHKFFEWLSSVAEDSKIPGGIAPAY